MPMVRCPECGRVADGSICFACGFEWSDDAAPDQPQASAEEQGGAPAATLPSPDIAPTYDGQQMAATSVQPISDPISEAGDILAELPADDDQGIEINIGDGSLDPFASGESASSGDPFAMTADPSAQMDPFAPPPAMSPPVDDPLSTLQPALTSDPFAPPGASESQEPGVDPLAALVPSASSGSVEVEASLGELPQTLTPGAGPFPVEQAANAGTPSNLSPPAFDAPAPTNPASVGEPQEVSATSQYQYQEQDIDLNAPTPSDVEVDPSFVRTFSSSFALEGFDTSTPTVQTDEASSDAVMLSEAAPIPKAWQKQELPSDSMEQPETVGSETRGTPEEIVSVPELPPGWHIDSNPEEAAEQTSNEESTTSVQAHQIIAAADDPLLPAEVDPNRISSEGSPVREEPKPQGPSPHLDGLPAQANIDQAQSNLPLTPSHHHPPSSTTSDPFAQSASFPGGDTEQNQGFSPITFEPLSATGQGQVSPDLSPGGTSQEGSDNLSASVDEMLSPPPEQSNTEASPGIDFTGTSGAESHLNQSGEEHQASETAGFQPLDFTPLSFDAPVGSPPPEAPPAFAAPTEQIPHVEIPPVEVPPLELPPEEPPAFAAPTEQIPHVEIPPVEVPPLEPPPEVPPAFAAPTEQIPLVEIPPVEAPPLDHPPHVPPAFAAPTEQIPLVEIPPLEVPPLEPPPEAPPAFAAPTEQIPHVEIPPVEVPPLEPPPEAPPAFAAPTEQIPHVEIPPVEVPPLEPSPELPPAFTAPTEEIPPVEVPPLEPPPEEPPAFTAPTEEIPPVEVPPLEPPPELPPAFAAPTEQIPDVEIPPVDVPPLEPPPELPPAFTAPTEEIPPGDGPESQETHETSPAVDSSFGNVAHEGIEDTTAVLPMFPAAGEGEDTEPHVDAPSSVESAIPEVDVGEYLGEINLDELDEAADAPLSLPMTHQSYDVSAALNADAAPTSDPTGNYADDEPVLVPNQPQDDDTSDIVDAAFGSAFDLDQEPSLMPATPTDDLESQQTSEGNETAGEEAEEQTLNLASFFGDPKTDEEESKEAAETAVHEDALKPLEAQNQQHGEFQVGHDPTVDVNHQSAPWNSLDALPDAATDDEEVDLNAQFLAVQTGEISMEEAGLSFEDAPVEAQPAGEETGDAAQEKGLGFHDDGQRSYPVPPPLPEDVHGMEGQVAPSEDFVGAHVTSADSEIPPMEETSNEKIDTADIPLPKDIRPPALPESFAQWSAQPRAQIQELDALPDAIALSETTPTHPETTSDESFTSDIARPLDIRPPADPSLENPEETQEMRKASDSIFDQADLETGTEPLNPNLFWDDSHKHLPPGMERPEVKASISEQERAKYEIPEGESPEEHQPVSYEEVVLSEDVEAFTSEMTDTLDLQEKIAADNESLSGEDFFGVSSGSIANPLDTSQRFAHALDVSESSANASSVEDEPEPKADSANVSWQAASAAETDPAGGTEMPNEEDKPQPEAQPSTSEKKSVSGMTQEIMTALDALELGSSEGPSKVEMGAQDQHPSAQGHPHQDNFSGWSWSVVEKGEPGFVQSNADHENSPDVPQENQEAAREAPHPVAHIAGEIQKKMASSSISPEEASQLSSKVESLANRLAEDGNADEAVVLYRLIETLNSKPDQ